MIKLLMTNSHFVYPIFQRPGAICNHHGTSESHYRVRSGDQGGKGASGHCGQPDGGAQSKRKTQVRFGLMSKHVEAPGYLFLMFFPTHPLDRGEPHSTAVASLKRVFEEMEAYYNFLSRGPFWSSKRLRNDTESPEVLGPTRSPEQRLPLPSSSPEEASAALAVGSTGSSGGGSGLAVPPVLQQLPPATISPATEVADPPPGAAAATDTVATLQPGLTGTGGGRPPLENSIVQQQPLLSTAEVGEGDAAAAAALMSLRLSSEGGA